ncbi:MAG: hypothetical protein AAGI23_09350 [Bacteroidota bacterium]
MTKISYIHGIPQDERWDRGQEVPAQSFINYSAMTEGEMKLALLKEQLEILAAYYPEMPDYRLGIQLIDNALYRGIHGAAGIGNPSGIIPKSLNAVVKTIRKAKRRTKPAAYVTELSGRNNISGGIGDERVIPVENCHSLYFVRNQLVYDRNGNPDFRAIYSDQAAYEACREQNGMRNMLNRHWEESSYHPVYDFITVGQAERMTQRDAGLIGFHRSWILGVHEITSLAQDNLRLWLRNGIVRNNATGGVSPISPEESIQQIVDGGTASINGDPVTLGLILKLIIAAISAAAVVFTQLEETKRTVIMARLRTNGFGTQDFAADPSHFFVDTDGDGTPDTEMIDTDGDGQPDTVVPPSSGNNGGLFSGNTMPFVIGGAALYLLMDD